MSMESGRMMAHQAVELVQSFFDGLVEEEISVLPEVLRSNGLWMAICDASITAVFFLDQAEQKRIDECKKNGWHPFPGFLIPYGQEPSGYQAANDVQGPFSFYSSEKTTNMVAFSIRPGSSCTVLDHFHEIADPSGTKLGYKVHLAFIVGLSEEEEWSHVMHRLSELLDRSVRVWRES